VSTISHLIAAVWRIGYRTMLGIPKIYRKKVKIEEYLLDELKAALGIDNDAEAVSEAVRQTIEFQETLLLFTELERRPPFQENWEQDPDAWRRED